MLERGVRPCLMTDVRLELISTSDSALPRRLVDHDQQP
jgi:hypothetical protein